MSRSALWMRAQVCLGLLVFSLVAGSPARAQQVGCSVTEWKGIQQGLDLLFSGACTIHDRCYRACNNPYGPYKMWGWKNGCDITFLANMLAACDLWAVILSFPNSEWIDAGDFLEDCGAVAVGIYAAVVVGGDPFYLNQQALHCNAWANGGSVDWWNCNRNCGYEVDCYQAPWHPDCPMCPIAVDLQGNGLKLSGLEPPSYFDFDGDGVPDRSSWTREQTKDGFLVLDRNRDGLIESGREMFGNATPLVLSASIAAHGYEALAELDDSRLGGNQNGAIDSGDAIFEHLRLWLDKNRDNVSQAEELISLEDAGVSAIDLDYYFDGTVDQWGNELRWKSTVSFADGSTSEATDVFFKRQDDGRP